MICHLKILLDIIFNGHNVSPNILLSILKLGHFSSDISTKSPDIRHWETRAQGGIDRSPEYNEHFCYKLDFLANQKAWLPYLWDQSEKQKEVQRPYISHSLEVSSVI